MLLRRITKHVTDKNWFAVFGLFIMLNLAACATTDEAMPKQRISKAISSDLKSIDTTFPPTILELNFKSYGDRLNAILYQANGVGPHPTVVLLHGYPGNEKNLDLAQSLRRAGFNVLFFHYRGAWGSDGSFSLTNVIEDVASAVNYLRNSNRELRVNPEQIMLIGHSMGGFAALQGAVNDTAIICVAGIASADVGALAGLAAVNSDFAQGFSDSTDNLTMLAGWTGAKLLNSLQVNRDEFSLVNLAPKLSGKSVLLVAGDKDGIIAPEIFDAPMVAAYKAQAGIDLTHAVISGDHSFSWSRIVLSQIVLDWAVGCMDPK